MGDVIELFIDCAFDLLFGICVIALLYWWLLQIIGG